MIFNKSIFGMIHLSGLEPVERALEEIKIYEDAGLQGAIVENYHGSNDDVVDLLRALPKTNLDIGINILPNEYEMAFELANKYGKFIQLDYVAGRYDRNQELDYENYLLFRNKYSNIKVMGGVWPKYYVPVKGSVLENDLDKAEGICDAVVVTGSGTGKETPLNKIKFFKEHLDIPVIIGAGLNSDNLGQIKFADGAIVGSCFKQNSNTNSKVDPVLVSIFMKKLKTTI